MLASSSKPLHWLRPPTRTIRCCRTDSLSLRLVIFQECIININKNLLFENNALSWVSIWNAVEPVYNDIGLYETSVIQGVSRLVDITADDFLGLCDQKVSYKHVSDFGRLRTYGHFLIPVHALVWTASYRTSWRVMYSTWWLIVCGSCNEQLAQFTTERQPVLRPVVAFSKTTFKHRLIQIKDNFTKLTSHLYFKFIMYYAGILFCSLYCQ